MENKSIIIQRPENYLRALSSAYPVNDLKPTIGTTDVPVVDNLQVAETKGTDLIYWIVGLLVVGGVAAHFIYANYQKDKIKENSKDEGRKADAPIVNKDVEVKQTTGENSIQPNQNKNASFGNTESLFKNNN